MNDQDELLKAAEHRPPGFEVDTGRYIWISMEKTDDPGDRHRVFKIVVDDNLLVKSWHGSVSFIYDPHDGVLELSSISSREVSAVFPCKTLPRRT